MTHRICFCPESVRWILNHLKASSRSQFRKMIKTGSISKITKRVLKRKRRFSAKQLRAQRLFAKRARAGTLRRRR